MNKYSAMCVGVVFILVSNGMSQGLETAVSNVVAICESSRFSTVYAVEDMGFRAEVYTQDVFVASSAFLSNNWQNSMLEWPSIRDKYETRVVFTELAGFAGTNAFLGILNAVAMDAQTNAVSKSILPRLAAVTRTPLGTYVIDHYSDPPVSNILQRLISVFDDAPVENAHYRRVLSGEVKRQFDEMRACGALEFWHESR